MITISKEQKLKNFRIFSENKEYRLNLYLDLKLEELQSIINDIVHIRSELCEIEKKCDY